MLSEYTPSFYLMYLCCVNYFSPLDASPKCISNVVQCLQVPTTVPHSPPSSSNLSTSLLIQLHQGYRGHYKYTEIRGTFDLSDGSGNTIEYSEGWCTVEDSLGIRLIVEDQSEGNK